MCNAWNHPADCNCGWGGGYGAGGGGSSFAAVRVAAPIPQVFFADGFLWRSDRKTTNQSYTIPNATCPVCGASVYYYQSPYGGRVFFDDLGPPWPKHPCTDNYFRSDSGPRPVEEPGKTEYRDSARFGGGWKPLSNLKVTDSEDEFVFFEGFTYDPVDIRMFALRKICNVNFDGPLFCRRMTDGRWEVSWIPSSPSYLELEPQTAVAIPFYPIFRPEHIEIWDLASRGDIEAQNMVGMMLTFHHDSELARQHGRFPQKCDWTAAKMWFEAAAATGYWPAVNNLGVMYECGYGVEKDPSQAFELYSRAAEEMSPTALYHLADCYEQGIGTRIDMEMARYLRELATVSSTGDGEDENKGKGKADDVVVEEHAE